MKDQNKIYTGDIFQFYLVLISRPFIHKTELYCSDECIINENSLNLGIFNSLENAHNYIQFLLQKFHKYRKHYLLYNGNVITNKPYKDKNGLYVYSTAYFIRSDKEIFKPLPLGAETMMADEPKTITDYTPKNINDETSNKDNNDEE